MKKLLVLLIFGLTVNVQAQTFYTDLFGFRIGQYREACKNQFGKPFKTEKFDDGFEYEAFLLEPDTSLVIVFEYSKDSPNIIWSIQVSGSNSTTDIGFKSAKLGTNRSETEQVFGKPSLIKDIGEYGHQWIYDKSNISLEVNTKGRFSSIKILDNSNELYPSGPDLTKIPSFEIIRKTLNSDNNSDILKLLSGDLEIYVNDSTYYFKKSFLTEQITDYSKILSLLKKLSKDLMYVNTENHDEYEENIRVILGGGTRHVIKLKKGHMIKEIVLNYFAGRYYIYEVNANNK